MKNLILICLGLVIGMSACNKEEPCETTNTGELCVTNETTATIRFSLSGSRTLEIASGETECLEAVSSGVRTYTAISSDGSFWPPQEADIRRCIRNTLTFRR